MKTTPLFAPVAAAAAGIAGAIGAFVLLAGDHQTTVVTVTGAIVRPMERWAGLSLLLLGAGLGALSLARDSALVRRAAMSAASVVLAASALSVVLNIAGLTPAEGSLLATLQATRVLGGLTLGLAAVALLLLSLGRLPTAVGASGVGLAVIGGSMLIALAYGGPLFIQREWPMVGLPAALAASLFGLAVILINGADAWPVRYFVGPTVSALLLRYLLPVVALAVLLTDAATNLFFSGFSPAIGSTFNTVISLVLSSIVIAGLGRVIGARLDRSYAALTASEDKFRRVFMTLPAGLAVSRLEDGRFVDVNDEFMQTYGYRKEEVIGRTSTELGMWARSDDRQSLTGALRASAGDQRDVELEMRARDGRALTLRTSVHVLDLDGEPSMISTFIDVTERKQAERARARSDAQLAAIFRESPIPLSVTKVESGKLVAVNPAFLEAYAAASEAEVLGRSRGELGIWGPEVRHEIVEQLKRNRRAQGVFPVRRLDGELRTFQVSASTYTLDGELYSLGASMDITDRLRLEEERASARQQYQELFGGVRDVVFSLSTEGIITVLNPAFEAVTGMPTSDWIGRLFLDLVHPDDAERAMSNLKLTLAGKPKDDQPLRIRTATGYRFAEIFSAPRWEDGRVVGILGIGRDVSERMTLEDQLRQSQKMEAMGSLAGGIAHDFNNLLTVIIGFGQLTLANSSHRALTEDVTEMVNAAERAAEMTRQLLAFSRKQVREPRDVNLNTVLGGVEKMLRRMIGEHVVLRSVCAPDLGVIRADPGQLEQVVANLAVNARDAMPDGGVVTMSTANVALDDAFVAEHADALPGDYVRLRVADTGTGMSPETRKHIFEPFFTTKEVGKGTGLGLSTVFGIVQQSQGFVVVESAVGAGTIFDIYFPRVEPRGDGATGAPGGAISNRGTETILVAEDSAPLRSLAVRALSERGYTVLAAANGSEAIDVVCRQAGGIDLLITDVVMPGLSGPALAEALANMRPGIRVLYVSGYSDDMLGQRGVLDPGIMLLPKPFTPDALANRVREVLDRSLSPQPP